MNNEFGMRELYSVVLKPTYPIEVGGREFAAGEVIASFDKIMVANFQEIGDKRTAHGGTEDRVRIVWQTTKGINVTFTQGIFSKTQFALMSNSKLYKKELKETRISQREELESNEEGIITLSHIPVDNWIFIYDKETKEKITGARMVSEKAIDISSIYTDVIVDYEYEYGEEIQTIVIGQEFIDGFFTLEGRTKVKDDITGQVKTGIIKIPKLKLTSDLSVTLGSEAQPVVGQFNGLCLPVGPAYQGKAMEILFLSEDIDSDF